MRHQKVHERPQLHQVVLQGGARQKEPSLSVEIEQYLPLLRFEVFNVVSLI